ncbi:PD-(D/E)XK nuclease family protein [candidate division WOR-3 bacterium]|nr:PD-(D/E)XK nuclease family protein [candidate division WOR-3 bacterium]
MHRDNDWWHASSLGLCMRKHYFRRMGLSVSNPTPYRIRFVAQDGNAGHAWREKAAKSMGVLIACEERLRDKKLKYSGRFDLLIELQGEKVLIDIKTQRPEAFFRRSRKSKGEQVENFQKQQLASYVYFAKKKWPDLKEARIYYVDRGGGVREEFSFLFKKERFKKVTDELKTLNKYWEKKKIPPVDKTWLCKFCNYKDVCKKVEKSKLNFKQVIQKYA